MKNFFKKKIKSSHTCPKELRPRRNCNLCSGRFHPKTLFDRYCADCKEHSELLKFSEGFPSVDGSIAEKILT